MEQQQPNNKQIPHPSTLGGGESEEPEVQEPQEEEQEARPEGEFKEFCELSFGGFDMKLGSSSLRADQLTTIILDVYNQIKLNNGDKSKEGYVG